MFFTKVQADKVIGPHIDHVRCAKCHDTGYTLQATIKYLSVDFINLPLMIVQKDYQFSCQCGHHQSPCVKPKHLKELKQQMLPWHYFATKYIGLMLIILTAWYMVGIGEQKRYIEQQVLQNPQVNDFYFVDYHRIDPDSHPLYRYTVLKVTNVEDDKVTALISNVSKSRKGRVYDHIKGDRPMIHGYFSSKTIELTTQQLLDYRQDETLFAARRPHNFYIEGSIVIPVQRPKVYKHQVNMDNQLGIALYRGEEGYLQNYQAAFEAFTRAANANNAAGQHNLAQMYRDGIGTERDLEKALFWFSKAANQGYAKAINAQQALLDVPPGAFSPFNFSPLESKQLKSGRDNLLLTKYSPAVIIDSTKVTIKRA